MTSRIVAIPVFAAIWLGAPAVARAQDQEPAASAPVETIHVQREAPRRVAVLPQSGVLADQRHGGGGGGGGRGGGGGGGRGPAPSGGGRPSGAEGSRQRPPVYGNPRSNGGANVNIYARPYGRNFYAPSYYDRWARSYYGWSPLAYAPWAFIYGTAGYAGYGYSYGPYDAYGGYGYGGGYGGYGPYGRATTFDTGGLRLKVRPRDAQVFVDGYYAGLVDDFDGAFQSLRLEQGGHKVEIRMPGFETLNFDVHIQPDRTLVLKEDLRARP